MEVTRHTGRLIMATQPMTELESDGIPVIIDGTVIWHDDSHDGYNDGDGIGKRSMVFVIVDGGDRA